MKSASSISSQALAKANPPTYVVDAERALFGGDVLSADVLEAASAV